MRTAVSCVCLVIGLIGFALTIPGMVVIFVAWTAEQIFGEGNDL